MKIEKIFNFIPLSIPVKLILGGLIGAIGGSGYIGFLSEYATYYYAWDNSFRIPAEGSPYLKIAITSITFLIILASSFLFAGFYAMVKMTVYFNKMIAIPQNLILQRRGVNKSVKIAILVFNTPIKKEYLKRFLIWIAIILFLALMTIGITAKTQSASPDSLTYPAIAVLSSIATALYILPLVAISYKKTLIPISISMSLFFIVASPLFLFNQNAYSTILRVIGYGGGVKVVINNQRKPEYSSLLLRTTDSIFIRQENQNPIEIPLSEVKEIKYLN
ncbi:hypothetical protein [uncultured Pantoea sp.]|uniref:hypothetical protein n=1 Tax=uncultured Pantoea sp. TaxID=218084 RepID=UPI0025CEBBBF|nr:hypothetical protein [uncultured Pantoea sp.]